MVPIIHHAQPFAKGSALPLKDTASCALSTSSCVGKVQTTFSVSAPNAKSAARTQQRSPSTSLPSCTSRQSPLSLMTTIGTRV